MAKDLTIRILGRPQVSKDDAVGYQRISRQYVVEGYRASYSGINDPTNPLFLAVGTEDEEFEGHYLVDQKISPKQGSVDVAYLTREFVEVRDTWSSEQFAQSKGFKRVTRQFVVLRAVSDLGYTQQNFDKHPNNNSNKDYSPWDYLATVVGNSEPDVGEEFSIPLNTTFNHTYRRSNISVDTKNPGFDVWSVTWTAPIRPEGEPSITKDSQLGYQTVSRSYVISGEYFTKSKIFDGDSPLFLNVGTADHEYADHYLVNQEIKPLNNVQDGEDSIEDLAVLTRSFVKIRDTWSTENFSQSRGFKKITRQFVVLRAQHTLGYTEAVFDNHPVNTANKEYSPWKYLPTVVADSEPDISELFNIPTNIEFNQKWHRSTISVDSKNPGVDVWSVSWTAPIRPEGEPTITKDSQIGFQTVTRSYVITGDYYTKANMFDGLNPLFLDVGTADHEYTDHYLVNQAIKPMLNMQKEGDDTVEDLAILTRQFVEIRDSAFQESVTVANDLRKITRYFVVLRADHAKGYSPTGKTSTWNKHPSQASGYEPWEYAPHPVSEPPTTVARSMPQSTPMNVSALLGEVGINDVINEYSEANSGEWLKGSASVRLSQPGVDVWTVSWATHTNPYWSAGGEKTLGSVNSKSPKTVDFDRDGLKVYSTDAEVRGNLIGQVATISFFVVGNVVTTNLSSNWQGVSNSDPSVCLDFYLIPYDGSKAISFNSVIDNAVFANVGSANLADLATGQGVTNGFRFTGGYYNGDDPSGLPIFKNMRIADGGGTITFTAAAPDSDATTASPITAKTDPIFTSGDPNETKRIWRVRISYAG